MARQDRFLTWILIFIAVLVTAAVAMYFLHYATTDYSGGNSPSDVIHDYVLAIQKSDYAQAYTYLADTDTRPTLDKFRLSMGNQRTELVNAAVEIGEESIQGNDAVVDITILHSSSDLFANVYRSTEIAQLSQENGQWKIVQMPYPYWGYDWEYYKTVPAEPTD